MLQTDDTCAPCRTLISVPLLSTDMKAASSISISVDNISLSDFENIAFSSFGKKGKKIVMQIGKSKIFRYLTLLEPLIRLQLFKYNGDEKKLN